MMEFFLSGSLPLIDFAICDVMSDMANELLSLSKAAHRGPGIFFTNLAQLFHLFIASSLVSLRQNWQP